MGSASEVDVRRWLACVSGMMALVTLTGCDTQRPVRSAYNRAFDFARHHAYAWQPTAPELPPGSDAERQALDRRVRNAVEAELAAKGYQYLRSGEPDLLVGYRITVKDATVETFQDYYDYWRSGGSGGPQEAFAFGYERGELVVEFVDPETQRPVWRGAAAIVIEANPQADTMREAVRQLLEHFPPQ